MVPYHPLHGYLQTRYPQSKPADYDQIPTPDAEIKEDGTKEEEYRYYICSIGEDAEEFERAARGHWGVEAKLHWHLDFTFRDDKNTSMGKTSAKNLQIMKKIALAILGLVKESYKISMKRIRYELSLDYENEIEKMLSMLDVDTIKGTLESKGRSPWESNIKCVSYR